MIKLTVTDKGIYYFSRERIVAIAKKTGKYDSPKYNEKNSFLPGNFFLDNFQHDWVDLYGSTKKIKCAMELTCKDEQQHRAKHKRSNRS